MRIKLLFVALTLATTLAMTRQPAELHPCFIPELSCPAGGDCELTECDNWGGGCYYCEYSCPGDQTCSYNTCTGFLLCD